MPRPALAAIAGIAAAGCHVQSRVATTRPGQARVERTDGAPRALPATIVLGDDGYLRFVTPLSCPADRLVEVEAYDTVRTEPNLAAFVVGVVVTAAGAVAAVSGLTSGDAGGSGWTWLGAGGVVVGLPLAIGPWRGTGDEDVPQGTSPLRTGATEVPCGDRPVAARHAVVHAGAGVDARVETLRKVPRLAAAPVAVARLTLDDHPVLRIRLTLDNDGPGDAWGVRAIVSATSPELDGRIVYVGRVPAGGRVVTDLLVPLTAGTDRDLAGDELALDLLLRDAHDTTPSTPVRFRGRVLADAPR